MPRSTAGPPPLAIRAHRIRRKTDEKNFVVPPREALSRRGPTRRRGAAPHPNLTRGPVARWLDIAVGG